MITFRTTLLYLIFFVSFLMLSCGAFGTYPLSISSPEPDYLNLDTGGTGPETGDHLGWYTYDGRHGTFVHEDLKCYPGGLAEIRPDQMAVWSVDSCDWRILESGTSWDDYRLYGVWNTDSGTLYDDDNRLIERQWDPGRMSARILQYDASRKYGLQIEVLGRQHSRITGWTDVSEFTLLEQLEGFVREAPIVSLGKPLFYYTTDIRYIRYFGNADGYCVPTGLSNWFEAGFVAVWDVYECEWVIIGKSGLDREMVVNSPDVYVFVKGTDLHDKTDSAVESVKTTFRILGVDFDGDRPWLLVEDIHGVLGTGYIDMHMLEQLPVNRKLFDGSEQQSAFSIQNGVPGHGDFNSAMQALHVLSFFGQPNHKRSAFRIISFCTLSARQYAGVGECGCTLTGHHG